MFTAIRKVSNIEEDVFISFPRIKHLKDNPIAVGDEKLAWLLEHAVDYGYRDEYCVGVYLNSADAIAFKLKFL